MIPGHRAAAGALLIAAALGMRVPAEGPHPRTHVVEMREFRFVPENLIAAVGDSIRWVNRDPVPHTATAADSSWDSGRLEAGGEWLLVVRAGGEIEYVCAYHPTMTGTLRVEARGR